MTGFLAAVFQLFFFHLPSQSVIPFLRYCESVVSTTAEGRARVSSPMIAAVSSILLLVVSVAAPDNSLSVPL